jgi:uncharacterized protein
MKNWFKKNKFIYFLTALATAFIGGSIFSVINTPIPWLLGPMTAVLIASRIKSVKLYWPVTMRDIGLIIVGYSIGLSFTKATMFEIITKLPSMFVMAVLLVLFCAGTAYLISFLTGIDYPTVLTGSMPGGLSQIIAFAEESKGIDITTVTFFQVTRLLMIVFIVPFLLFSPLFSIGGNDHGAVPVLNSGPKWELLFPDILFYGLLSLSLALIGKKIKLPTAFMLGPIIGIGALNIFGYSGPPLPSLILDISQFLIGGYIGLLLKPEKLKNKVKVIPLAILSSLLLITASIGLSYLLVYLYHFSFITSFLSLAPGGMDQMGIIGHELEADIAMITGFQLFRILFIFFAVPFFLRSVLNLSNRKNNKQVLNKKPD